MVDSIKRSRVAHIGTGTATTEGAWTVCNLTENIDNFDLLIIGFAQGTSGNTQARFNYPTIVTTVSDFKKTNSTYFDIVASGYSVYYENNTRVSFLTANSQVGIHIVGVKL